jgi:integrase
LPPPPDHIGTEIARFVRYMDGACGLATSTRRQRGQILTPFLTARFGTGPVTAAAITAADLRRFALGADQIRDPGTVRVMAGALRCYLRFREIEGDPVGALRASIPGAAHWRLATLPAVLTPAQVDELLLVFAEPHLTRHRAVSPCTVAAYRDTYRLLLLFVEQHIGKAPTAVTLADLDAQLILAFLDHLEHDRGNGAPSRNARLAAIRSFLRYAVHHDLSAMAVIERALAVPMKRFDRPLLGHLDRAEMQAILDAPDRQSWAGQRAGRC